ncbi:hypothetical protein DFH06DRAFT_534646 [Mycena polygramma]|nr:hypothetical protein DFH06DRAFT_534646 [Mycena polygramma]
MFALIRLRTAVPARLSLRLSVQLPFSASFSLSASATRSAWATATSQSVVSATARAGVVRSFSDKPRGPRYNICMNLCLFRPPRRPQARRLHGAHDLRRLRRRGPPAQGLPQPRPRAPRGDQERAAQVLPLRRRGAHAQGVQRAAEVLWVWGDGPHPPRLHHQPA